MIPSKDTQIILAAARLFRSFWKACIEKPKTQKTNISPQPNIFHCSWIWSILKVQVISFNYSSKDTTDKPLRISNYIFQKLLNVSCNSITYYIIYLVLNPIAVFSMPGSNMLLQKLFTKTKKKSCFRAHLIFLHFGNLFLVKNLSWLFATFLMVKKQRDTIVHKFLRCLNLVAFHLHGASQNFFKLDHFFNFLLLLITTIMTLQGSFYNIG